MEVVGDALRAVFGPGWRVRTQLPVALDDDSEPEPDSSVVAGTARETIDAIPSRPVLIVEIADTSLHFDRWRYGNAQTVARPASIAPLALPSARIAVADLLP
jgi:hypothetical protein